tara:strand:+ start:2662 stop:2856 length:195 start_codon:yes stop_codon:yes gene_type:complete
MTPPFSARFMTGFFNRFRRRKPAPLQQQTDFQRQLSDMICWDHNRTDQSCTSEVPERFRETEGQ